MRTELGVTLVGVVGGLALLCANAETIHAGQAGLAPFWVKVMTVRADDSGACDPRLATLRSRLRRSVGYKSYTLLDKEFRRVPVRTTESFNLPNDRTLLLLPKGMQDGRILMQVRLLQGRHRILDTNVRLLDGGKMVFGLGKDARSGDGALLIVLEAESDLSSQTGNAQAGSE
jgi:hypothetical protein